MIGWGVGARRVSGGTCCSRSAAEYQTTNYKIRALSPSNKGDAVTLTDSNATVLVIEEPAYAGQLNALAAEAGVTVPDLSVEVAVPVNPAVSTSDVLAIPGLSDTATVKVYIKAYKGRHDHGTPRISLEQASAAATRLGDEGLLKLTTRMGAKARRDFAQLAFSHGWLSPSLVTLEALSLSAVDRGELLETLWYFSKEALDTSVSASELTAWVGADLPDGLVRAAKLWSNTNFPEGVIDDAVIASLGLVRAGSDRFCALRPSGGKNSPRLSEVSVRYLIKQGFEYTELALSFAVSISAKVLVALYDSVLETCLLSDEYLETGIKADANRALHPIVQAMYAGGYTTRAVLARIKDYALANARRGGVELSVFTLNNIKLNDDELVEILDRSVFVRWLDGVYAKNQPKKAAAVRIAQRWEIREVLGMARTRVSGGAELAHPERYEWFITQLMDEQGFPNSVRHVLTHGERDERFPIGGLGVKAAAKAFAAAPREVRTRLWRSFASDKSLFDNLGESFNSVTVEFVTRSEQAAARMAARSGARA
jgi:hypothetical protein